MRVEGHRGRGRLAALAVVVLVGLLPPGPVGAASRDTGQPAKINWVDTSAAPVIRVFGSILGSDSRPILPDLFKSVTLSEKPDRGKAKPLFSIADDEVTWHNRGDDGESDEAPGEDEEVPALTLGEEQEEGLDVVVLVPGFAPTYRDTELGQAVKDGSALFFKKLGKANRMNLLWYSDVIRTFVEAKGRTNELSVLTDDIQARCAAQQLDELERFGEPPPEEPVPLADDRARCGLTASYDGMGDIIAATAFEGGFPNLFGIEVIRCAPPEMEQGGVAEYRPEGDDEKEEGQAGETAAMDLALEMLVAGSKPGRQSILILASDGRDGYVHAQRDCREALPRTECKKHTGKERRACVNRFLKQSMVREQRQFADKAQAWIALAKSVGIRIFTVVHPTAQPHERERLELLAWRTGGTARVAEDHNQLIDLYSGLIDEINGQYVLTFTDEAAVPGAERQYQVTIKGAGGKTKTKPYAVQVPPEAEQSLAGTLAGMRAGAEAKLGRNVLLAIALGIALILLLILLKIIMGIFKKKAAGAAKGKKKKKGKK